MGWLAGLLLISSLLRLPALDAVPPGFQFDETYNAWDALRVVEGARPMFLASNAGREPLYTYWQALFVARWGPSPTAVRLASAVPGIATVLLLYGFVRVVVPGGGTELAGLTALSLALSFWHVHFSRYGIRSVLVPMLELPTLAALWLGLRRRGTVWFALCGVGLAAMIWTHPVGRLMPVMVAVLVLYAAWNERVHWRGYLLGLICAGLVTLLLALPLGRYFWDHPDQFFAHTSDVSILDPRVHQGSPIRALALNVLRVGGMFTFAGDREWLHNLPGRPSFDPLLSIAFLIGLGLSLGRVLRRGRRSSENVQHALIGVWLVTLLLPSVFSDMAPNFSRTIGAAPVAMLLAARALRQGRKWLADRDHPRLATGLVAAVMAASGVWTSWDYFVRFARSPLAYYHYDRDKMDVAAFLRQESVHNAIFLAPLWAQHPTVSLLTRDTDVRTVESHAAMVFPAKDGEKGVLYALPPEQSEDIALLERVLGTWGQRDVLYDSHQQVLLHLFRISARHRPLREEAVTFLRDLESTLGPLAGTPAQFGESIRLLGYQVSPEPSPEQELDVTLVWEALSLVPKNYTAFVHLFDSHGQQWGQVDNWPGQGSYPTHQWHVGDVIVDHYPVKVNPCLPPDRYRLEVGWYELSSGEQVRTEKGGLAARLGPFDIEPTPPVAPGALPSPGHRADHELSGGVRLIGFDLSDTVIEVGRPFPLTLHWEATADVHRPVICKLQLLGPEGEVTDVETLVAGGEPSSRWDQGQARCQTLRLHLDAVPEESYQLVLQAAGQPSRAVELGTVDIVASRRRFTVPPMRIPVGEDLGDSVRLLGCDVPGIGIGTDGAFLIDAGNALRLTLYWRSIRPTPASYTVFTHLLDQAGQLTAQEDAIPVAGTYPTSEWVEGEVVEDHYEMALPKDILPGSYQIEVGMYDRATGERLPLTKEGEELAEDHILLPIAVTVR